MTTGFRRRWLATLPLGLLDLGMHVAAAWLLVGPWWLQYLPDVMVPLLWLRSTLTDEMAPDHAIVLRLHRLLHVNERYFYASLILWWGTSLLLAFVLGINVLVLPAHVLFHIAIDKITHGKGWQ